ncbi:MAG: response regulator [Anaerolineales bacterium]
MMAPSDWRVIVVEDTFDDLQVMMTIFEHYGIPVWGVQSCDECHTLLDEIQPTVVITDLAMPNADGWEVLRQVREHPSLGHVPVVAMTSYHSDKLAQDVERGGFDGYFPKPVDPSQVIGFLSDILQA